LLIVKSKEVLRDSSNLDLKNVAVGSSEPSEGVVFSIQNSEGTLKSPSLLVLPRENGRIMLNN
jgi:hypothetical protein